MSSQNKPVQCKDGFRMSVQASRIHYCTPSIDDANEYHACEVGFPSQAEPLLMQWAESPDRPTGTVYGYVPAHVIAQVIAKHGGMVSGEVPAGVGRYLVKGGAK